MTTNTRKSSGFILRPFDDPEAELRPEQLRGRPLTPVPFMPESGRPEEADGAPLTKYGWRFRETLAELEHCAPSAVPLGMVRQAEALNADTDENLAGLARPAARHTEFGVLWSVPQIVNAPLLMPWLINGRVLRRLNAKLGGEIEVLTSACDHPDVSLPTMRVQDHEQVLELQDVQRDLLGFSSYSGDHRNLVDSIASHGVLEPPDVVLTQLVGSSGTAWTAQTAEGARRLFADQLGMTTMANRDVASLATKHWMTGGLRDLRPDDLSRLAEALVFPDSAIEPFFPGRDPRAWLDSTARQQPAAVAWQLMRTMRVNLVVAVEPNSRTRRRFEHPVAATVQELIRSFHVRGKSKAGWEPADVDGLVAITAIDRFQDEGRISPTDRAVWLGRRSLPWDNPLDGQDGDANLLTTTVRLLALLTVQGATRDAAGVDGLDVVRDVLRDNGIGRPQPTDRARVAVAQSMVLLDHHGSGHENQIAAALQSLFRDALLWKGDQHPGGLWTTYLGLSLADLEAKARAELGAMPDVPDPQKDLGPAQRALGALGMTALIVNPAMLVAGTAVTRTGKGGGGKATDVSASDPSKLVARMLCDEVGIDQLVDAVTALVAGRAPASPNDRTTHEPLTDFSLRKQWLGSSASTVVDESPAAAYARHLQKLVDAQDECKADADWLKEATAAVLLDAEADLFSTDEDATSLYETIGVPPDLADRAREALRALDEFFAVGKAYGLAASRFGR